MALAAAAITAERFAPWPERAARVTGALVIVAGVVVLTRALGGSCGQKIVAGPRSRPCWARMILARNSHMWD